jgi:hypothetical protein
MTDRNYKLGPNDFDIEIIQTLPSSYGPNYQAAWAAASMEMWSDPRVANDRERGFTMDLDGVCAVVNAKECCFSFFFRVREV